MLLFLLEFVLLLLIILQLIIIILIIKIIKFLWIDADGTKRKVFCEVCSSTAKNIKAWLPSNTHAESYFILDFLRACACESMFTVNFLCC